MAESFVQAINVRQRSENPSEVSSQTSHGAEQNGLPETLGTLVTEVNKQQQQRLQASIF